ncbi:GlxA family transcriptional regulator [Ovoidimarina sediminis]|uniref:GlxA family transcriptional regulator n=1 Tax=Ovoidimarina sediminis TaxID=3079856 RepID=UPI00290D1A6E|nr:GlxA family transcriptional regulator [Rhodophyticola sp. MJ-SS7]MDU8943592.1 GlxA family transcriptional regulator [Rhodophyticola sp. MJ-SS7]
MKHGQKTRDAPARLHLVLTPDFNLAATMAFVDPFRAANYLEGVTLFQWRFLSGEGGMVRASNAAAVMTEPLEPGAGESDVLIVSSSWEPEAHLTGRLRAALRSAAAAGVTLGGIDTGAFILARSGLLNGHRATVHYEHIDAFRELFPKVDVTETLWVFDRLRITCCGGAATTEFALHLLQRLKGSALANAAARYVFSQPLRDHNAPQDPQTTEPLGVTVPESVRRAIDVMEDNLELPLPIAEICRRIGISHRQLDRLFDRYVCTSPALYYRDIRLDRARGLVTQTNLSMAEIAYASGFSSQAYFSRAYRDRFGLAPSKDRIEGRIPFEFRAWPMHRGPER